MAELRQGGWIPLMILRTLRRQLSGFLYLGWRRTLIQFGLNLRDALKLDVKLLRLLLRQALEAANPLLKFGDFLRRHGGGNREYS
jgi:hypothetical protein